jgi:F0F1-type ATP synthase assembly protein I
MTTPDGTDKDGQAKPYEPMPSAPALSEQELAPPPAVARPKSVDNSFLLWLVITGLGVLSLILTLTVGSDDITEQARKALEDAGKSTSPSEVESAANAAKMFAVIGGLLFTGLYLLFVFMMRGGKNWARITLAILGLIGIIGTLIQLRSVGAVTMIFGFLQVLLILGAAYFMFRPDANQYFAAGKRR